MTSRPPELRVHLDDELIVDNFAGGGGASTGMRLATGRDPDIAINHDAEALAMHRANHPSTLHLCEDVFDVSPRKVCKGRRVGLAHFSPDCTFHSKARGGKPHRDRNKARRRRGLAGVAIRWAREVRPRIITVENVEEFQDWGPLGEDGRPDPAQAGLSFRRWVAQLRNLGYAVEWRELRACDYGSPTSRKRLFVVARCDGRPIVWPAPTHGPGRAQPYRTAAECIDWSIPCPSIFERKKPLAENTLRRIARGIRRYVLEAAQPFIVPVTHAGDARVHPVDEPLRTVTGAQRGEQALVAPLLSRIGQTGGNGAYVNDVRDPLTTATTKAEHLLVTPVLAKFYGRDGDGSDPAEPLGAVTGRSHHAVVAPMLVRTAHGEQDATGKRRGRGEHDLHEPLPTACASRDFALVVPSLINTRNGERKGQAPRVRDIQEPMPTVTALGSQGALVAAFLATYHGDKRPGDVRGAELAVPAPTQDTSNRHAITVAHLAKHYGGNYDGSGAPLDGPAGTVTTQDHHALVTSHLLKLRGGLADHQVTAQDLAEPAPTITASGTHLAEVRAFLVSYYRADQNPQLSLPAPTLTTKHRLGLVTVHGVDYAIVDVGMRMLEPRELFNAQGFPAQYVIDPVVHVKHGKQGRRVKKKLTKTAQVRMCGNAVPPDVIAAIVAANLAEQGTRVEREEVA